jgi:alcohol dehydrogenase
VTLPSFLFQHQTVVDFGAGAVGRLGEHAARLEARRLLFVCDEGLERAGLADRVEEALAAAGIDVTRFTDVSPNPRDEECRAAADTALAAAAEAVLGLGGGSVMDTAKAAAALATNGGTVKDWEDPRRLARAPLPTLCVPTTAGTGSEVTFVAVITDEREHYKMTLLDPRLAPDVAVLDPELTLTLPPSLTAATGMDALTHAVEAYTGRAATPLTDVLALRSIELVAAHLRRAVSHGGDLEARAGMLLASLLAGMAFGNSDVGAVHCMGETVGGLYDTPHGVACAVFLPEVFEFNVVADPARHAVVARALGVPADGGDDAHLAAEGAGTIRRLMADIGIPRFRELDKVTPADFETMARMAAEHVCSPDNAREIGYDDYLALFVKAYEG